MGNYFVEVWDSYTALQRKNIGICEWSILRHRRIPADLSRSSWRRLGSWLALMTDILGIFFYILGLEFFNGEFFMPECLLNPGSITTLATDRFNSENAFTKLGAAQGLNQAMQCVGEC